MQQLDRDEVSLLIHAPAERLYALVADVTRTPEFSPSVVRCTWINGATGPAVGARFEAVNTTEAGKTWRNRPVVTVADPVEAGHAKRLLRLAAEPPDGPVPPELDAARRASAGVYVSFFGVSQILAFLYLMTNKPGLLGACTACVVAAVLSALLAAARLRALTRAAPIGAPPVSAAPDGTPVHDRG